MRKLQTIARDLRSLPRVNLHNYAIALDLSGGLSANTPYEVCLKWVKTPPGLVRVCGLRWLLTKVIQEPRRSPVDILDTKLKEIWV